MWTVTLAATCVLALAAVVGAASFQTDVVKALETSKNLYVATKRKDGSMSARAPIWFMYDGNAVYFSTGPEEQKAKNLAANSSVAVVTGCNEFEEGLDVVVEGRAVTVTDPSSVELLAKTLNDKYDNFFGFNAHDGKFVHDGGGTAHAYVVVPTKSFAYARGATYSATRYR